MIGTKGLVDPSEAADNVVQAARVTLAGKEQVSVHVIPQLHGGGEAILREKCIGAMTCGHPALEVEDVVTPAVAEAEQSLPDFGWSAVTPA